MMDKNIKIVDGAELLNIDYVQYALYCILDRAIVNIYDGLKPSQRRILDTMHKDKIYNFTKSANVEGKTMLLHPHGGTYETAVAMVQEDYQNTPLLTGKGNFGFYTTDTTKAAAARYTEIKLSPYAKDILKDVGKGYVDMIPNYDGTLLQSQTLPVKFPMALTQYSKGVAVGFSSTMLPYNLKEITEAIVKWVETGEKTFLYPDFATKGYIIKSETNLEKVNNTGKGSYTLRGNVYKSAKDELIIDEIPFTTKRENIVEDVINLYEKGQFKEIIDIKDLSGFNPKTKLEELKIWIKLRKGTNPDFVIEKLYDKTSLESKVSSDMRCLKEKELIEVGVWDVIQEWYSWRGSCLVKYTKKQIEDIKKEVELLLAINSIPYKDVDSIVKGIREFDMSLIVDRLMTKYNLNVIQAEYIYNLPVKHCRKDWWEKQIKLIEPTQKKLDELNKFINTPGLISKKILNDLKEFSDKFSIPRNTKIIDEVEKKFAKEIKKTLDDTNDYNIVITNEGYIYKFKNHNDNPKLKPGDFVKYECVLNNVDGSLMVINKKSNAGGRIKIKDVAITDRNSIGTFAGTLTDIDFLTIFPIDKECKYILHIYDNGRVVKIKPDAFVGTTKKVAKQGHEGFNLIDTIACYEDGLKLSVTNDLDNTKVIELDKMISKADKTGQGVQITRSIKEFEIIK